MMTITQTFEKFLQSLELTRAQRDNASQQHKYMREELLKRLSLETTFLTGSYARKTAVRPLNDIDVFVVFKETDEVNPDNAPGDLLNTVKQTLEEIYPGKTSSPQARSVNIEFTQTGISYDVVPAFIDRDDPDIYRIPDLEASAWIATNPMTHKTISTEANEAANKKLKPLLKAVKHANNFNDRPARSFHLEVLSWGILTSDPGAYIDGLVVLLRGLADQIMDPCPDPAGLGPDIRPSQEKLLRSQKWLNEAAKLADEAQELAAKGRTGEAHKKLRELFGAQWPEKGTSGKGGGGLIVPGTSVDDQRSRFG